jgi:hypothetical protein
MALKKNGEKKKQRAPQKIKRINENKNKKILKKN